MSIKKTFKEIIEFNNIFESLMKRIPTITETKLGYAQNRFFVKNIEPIFRDYNVALGNIRIEHALTNKDTGAVLLKSDTPRGYEYDPAGLKKVFKAEQNLDNEWNAKEFDLIPFICSTENLPKELNDIEKELFEGLIIKLID